jgi:hypothetical protein
MRDNLGDWLARRQDRGVQSQGRAAQNALEDCGISLSDLRREWGDQQQTQMSIRARESPSSCKVA